jgi:ABC-2 type transport system ATP-binding protein
MPVETTENMQFCADRIICARHLTKKFGTQVAVDDLTFDIPPGIIFGFIGPSGSGKTTTIRLLTGTYSPTSGEVLVLNRHPSQFGRDVRERIGYMPQLFFLYPNLSGWENLNFVASLYGMNPFKRSRLNELLDFVELQPHKHKLVRDYSGGMRRRLSLAATLISDPKLIFLDEPTAGIDPMLRNKFWEHFNQIKQEDRTIFVTTQYVGEVAYCDQVAILDEGRLLMIDSPAGLRYRAFGGNVVNLETERPLSWDTITGIEDLPFVKETPEVISDTHIRLIVEEAKRDIPDLMEWCNQRGVGVSTVEEYLPPFDDVFVHVVKKEGVDRNV